jgi:hypothetical protein
MDTLVETLSGSMKSRKKKKDNLWVGRMKLFLDQLKTKTAHSLAI